MESRLFWYIFYILLQLGELWYVTLGFYGCSLLPDLGSSFWGMALVLASTNLTTARIAAGCLALALFIVLFIAQNVRYL